MSYDSAFFSLTIQVSENDTKSTDNVGQNISLESVQKAKDYAHSNENLLIEEDQMMTAKNACDSTEQNTSADLMLRDLDANTQEKSLENKNDKSLSPSTLDSNKRRNHYNVAVKPAISAKFEEIVYNHPRQLNTNKNFQSALKTKLIEDKSEIINKQKASISTVCGETRSLDNASTRVVNSRYD